MPTKRQQNKSKTATVKLHDALMLRTDITDNKLPTNQQQRKDSKAATKRQQIVNKPQAQPKKKITNKSVAILAMYI